MEFWMVTTSLESKPFLISVTFRNKHSEQIKIYYLYAFLYFQINSYIMQYDASLVPAVLQALYLLRASDCYLRRPEQSLLFFYRWVYRFREMDKCDCGLDNATLWSVCYSLVIRCGVCARMFFSILLFSLRNFGHKKISWTNQCA